MSEDIVNVELEALRCVFPELSVVYGPARGETSVVVQLQPYTADNLAQQFVHLELTMILNGDYPNRAPAVSFTSSRGLSQQRLARLHQELDNRAEELFGEVMLLAMCMAAQEVLTEMNHPEGTCVFCLMPMTPEAAYIQGTCFHGYHLNCVKQWMVWLESQRATSSVEDSGAVSHRCQKRESDGVCCPVCRAPISSEVLLSALRESESVTVVDEEDTTAGVELDDDVKLHVENVRQRHAQIEAVQQAAITALPVRQTPTAA